VDRVTEYQDERLVRAGLSGTRQFSELDHHYPGTPRRLRSSHAVFRVVILRGYSIKNPYSDVHGETIFGFTWQMEYNSDVI